MTRRLEEFPGLIERYQAGDSVRKLSLDFGLACDTLRKLVSGALGEGHARKKRGRPKDNRTVADFPGLAEDFDRGLQSKKLTVKYHIHSGKLARLLAATGRKFRKGSRPPDQEKRAAIAAMRLEGKSLREIAVAVGVSCQRIQQLDTLDGKQKCSTCDNMTAGRFPNGKCEDCRLAAKQKRKQERLKKREEKLARVKAGERLHGKYKYTVAQYPGAAERYLAGENLVSLCKFYKTNNIILRRVLVEVLGEEAIRKPGKYVRKPKNKE